MEEIGTRKANHDRQFCYRLDYNMNHTNNNNKINNNNDNTKDNDTFFFKINTNLYLRISKPTPFTRINTNKKM